MVAGMKRSPGACIGKNLTSKRKGVVYVSAEIFFLRNTSRDNLVKKSLQGALATCLHRINHKSVYTSLKRK